VSVTIPRRALPGLGFDLTGGLQESSDVFNPVRQAADAFKKIRLLII
jgi:hypothetical protein